jgi:hypothetical protein
MGSGDQELGINDVLFARYKIQFTQWIHVVNQETAMNIIARHTKITTIIANNDFIASKLPLPRSVELLIHPPIEAKGLLSYKPLQVEILKPFLKRGEQSKLGISPSLHQLPP